LNKVYVFNLHFNGLGVVRSLGENGIEVVGLDSNYFAIGKYSKYLRKFYKVTDPSVSERGFINDLILLGNKEKIKPLLVPTNDVWSVAISRYKKELERYFIVYNPDCSVIESIINKKIFGSIMTKIGVKTPHTYEINSFADIYKLKDRLVFPLIIKPNSRMNVNRNLDVTKLYNANRLITINSFEEIHQYVKLINNYDFIIQQKNEGLSNRMYTVGIYADQTSNVLGVFCGRKVRGYPAEYGDCYAGESLWVDSLVDISKKVIKEIGFTGIAELEFKHNEIDNEYYLIEMNPRTWSWIGITPHTGVNLPLIAYNNMLRNYNSYTEMDKTKKVLWVRVLEDSYNCKNNYKGLNSKDFLTSKKEWRASLSNYDEVVYAEYTTKDKKPLYIYRMILYIRYLGKLVNSKQKGNKIWLLAKKLWNYFLK